MHRAPSLLYCVCHSVSYVQSVNTVQPLAAAAVLRVMPVTARKEWLQEVTDCQVQLPNGSTPPTPVCSTATQEVFRYGGLGRWAWQLHARSALRVNLPTSNARLGVTFARGANSPSRVLVCAVDVSLVRSRRVVNHARHVLLASILIKEECQNAQHAEWTRLRTQTGALSASCAPLSPMQRERMHCM